MPEILTKHPDIVKKLLNDLGAECGKGKEQKILKKCPKDSFCSLPSGELCVFGLDEIDKMTQFGKNDICGVEQNTSRLAFLSSGAAAFTLGFIVAFFLFSK